MTPIRVMLLLVPCALLSLRALPADAPPEKKQRGEVKLTDAARAIHKEALVFDGHNDLPWQFRDRKDLEFRSIDLRKPQKGMHTDIPRLKKGGVGAQFWAA